MPVTAAGIQARDKTQTVARDRRRILLVDDEPTILKMVSKRLEVSGILWDTTQPLAVINGQTVRVGQELDGYQIIEISPDRVSVTDGTETFQLRLSP